MASLIARDSNVFNNLSTLSKSEKKIKRFCWKWLHLKPTDYIVLFFQQIWHLKPIYIIRKLEKATVRLDKRLWKNGFLFKNKYFDTWERVVDNKNNCNILKHYKLDIRAGRKNEIVYNTTVFRIMFNEHCAWDSTKITNCQHFATSYSKSVNVKTFSFLFTSKTCFIANNLSIERISLLHHMICSFSNRVFVMCL